MTISYKTMGRGVNHVIVMHDWFCDSSSFDTLHPYLDMGQFTYAFIDLRGYGKSKSIQGECSIHEATQDVLAVADALKWEKFQLIGHSMSGLIAQNITVEAPERIKSVIAITPVPACGSPVPEDMIAFLEDAAKSNDFAAEQIISFMSGNQYGDLFHKLKVEKWRECSIPEARVAYLHMFAETDISNQIKGIKTPYLVIYGGHDAEAHSEEVMRKTFMEWLPQAKLKAMPCAGHYPMLEMPVALAHAIDTFLKETA